jgi:hypothetical protein
VRPVGACVDGVVDGEFRHGERVAPRRRIFRAVRTEDILHDAIDALRLLVSLQVVGGRHVESPPENCEECTLELAGESWITIRHEGTP